MANVTMVVNVPGRNTNGVVRQLVTGSTKATMVQRFRALIAGVMAGNPRGNVSLTVSDGEAARAFVLVTCVEASAVNGTDELEIGPVTLAVEAAPANENQFAKGSGNPAFAAALAAAINAHSVLGKSFVATVSANVVRIEAATPGVAANLIAISETGDGMTISGDASGFFDGGAGLGQPQFSNAGFGA